MKRILVLYYSQSGDVRRMAEAFARPLESAGVEIVWEEIQPTEPYPYPWRNVHRFFNVMPECVLGLPPKIATPAFDAEATFDLIVLAYQVWFLAPSSPIQSFFQSDHACVLRGRKVITISVSRDMWHGASLKMKKLLAEAKAIHIDNVVVTHISSMFFQQPLREEMARSGFDIPLERWFLNLKYKGNTGAASLLIMLEELYHSGKLKAGDRILCAVPERARFTFAGMHLTVQ